jgi:hypothetical protein
MRYLPNKGWRFPSLSAFKHEEDVVASFGLLEMFCGRQTFWGCFFGGDP